MTSRQGLSVSVGLTKDNQLASASYGKVFPFGPLKSASENTIERLATAPPPAHYALVTRAIAFSSGRHRSISTVNLRLGNATFITKLCGRILRSESANGLALRAIFYPGNGWAGGFMTRQGSTGLVRVENQAVTL
jgi:hypothetical protein